MHLMHLLVSCGIKNEKATFLAQIHPDCAMLRRKPGAAPPSQEKAFQPDVRRLVAGITVKEHQRTRPSTLRLCKQHL